MSDGRTYIYCFETKSDAVICGPESIVYYINKRSCIDDAFWVSKQDLISQKDAYPS